jgi:hypothetical protein
MSSLDVNILIRRFEELSSVDKKSLISALLERSDSKLITEAFTKKAGLEAESINFAPSHSARCHVCGK